MTIDTDLSAFLADLRHRRDRLTGYEVRDADRYDELLAEVTELGTRLAIADEELRAQHDELVEARQALDAALAARRASLRSSTVASLVTDTSGMVRELNEAAGSLLDRPAGRVRVPRPASGWFAVASRPVVRQLVRDAVTSPASARAVATTPDAVPRPVQLSIEVFGRDEAGPLLRWDLVPVTADRRRGGDGDRATLAAGFVTLAGGTPALDVAEIVQGLVEQAVIVLPADSAGLLLTDPSGDLRVAAASAAPTNHLEAFTAQRNEGPCADAVASGTEVYVADIEAAVSWPGWAELAGSLGIRCSLAVPLRVGDTTIGALNAFAGQVDAFDETDRAVVAALATVAAATVVSRRDAERASAVNGQLQHALNSRVVIEQAKGVVATAAHLTMDEAFNLIRATARSTNTRLADLAHRITVGEVDGTDLARRFSRR